MLACYMEVSSEKIEEMKEMSSDDFIFAIEELSESGLYKTYEMSEMCDGLHYLLTKTSALTPLKGNMLSEAIVGSEIFAGEYGDDSVSYVDYSVANDILNNLEELDFDNVLSEFDPNEFSENSIYPNIWLKEDKEELKNELKESFNSLKEFYNEITANGNGLIACIY